MAEPLKIGILRLCDAAPVIVAQDQGFFEAHGLRAEISVEPSWANIADKLGYGLLDAAVMLPPLALACAMGLRGRKTALAVPMSLSANGNAIVLSNAWKDWQATDAAGLKAALAAGAPKPRLAVVHGYSTHDLLLRYWLAAEGMDPERDVEITVLPPAETISGLAAGAIDGFCAGAPWGHVAARAGLGVIAAFSQDIWQNHPEKCLAVRADFAARHEGSVLALLAALRQACAFCAQPENRGALASLLSHAAYLDLPADLLGQALAPEEGGPQFAEPYPHPAHARWFAEQLVRWHKAGADAIGAAETLYRPDLFQRSGGGFAAPREEIFCKNTRLI
ncbi:MAG TPA: CmpA/NrtA family ABC transporter substrate-binding protein [Acidocella sp.]|jgi:NitT/TauT family transport system ATP-binding protein/nitrate/nitrite transport system substrate-binding protein|uniref:CmpA/NrtA family ABC transporter substrate-binding protein n=1 Tax=Acidocella sp. TaxID=50710 RepID=UPI002C4D9BBB|nr:CmpA/NrtA family ABC transporter substrate-binding protein [Acidocella sp.]HVE22287.1 CmpA/NrtA family ABC transporter substrate-binding protein [Acidocella sp.]